jgi:hypothetical protein
VKTARTYRAGMALAACALALVAAPTAHAWRELPAYDVPGGGVADCLRAAGPGEVALLGRLTRASAATDLLDIGAAGVEPRVSTTLGWLGDCADAGAAPGTPSLLAGAVVSDPRSLAMALRVAVPGSPPATLSIARGMLMSQPAVAAAPDGAAVVAWNEVAISVGDDRSRVVASMRPAGGSFGPPVVLGRHASLFVGPAVGIDADGDATVAWRDDESSSTELATLEVASIPAGGRFGAPQRIVRSSGEDFALAVAPNGRALLAADAGDLTGAWERASATGPFTPVALPDTDPPDEVAVALAPDGGAAIAVRSDGVFATLRRPGGRFGRLQRLEAASQQGTSYAISLPRSRPQPPPDDAGARIAAAVGAGGDVVVSWVDPAAGAAAPAARVVHGTLDTGLGAPTRLGVPCRAANATTPPALRDGRLGVTWTDNARTTVIDGSDIPHGSGRLYAATPDAPGPQPRAAAPSVSARLLGSPALHVADALRVRARCRRGPCELRAVAPALDMTPDFGGDSVWFGRSTVLGTGRSATLRLTPTDGYSFATSRQPRRSTVTIFACGPTGAVARLTLHPRLRRLAPRPIPRVIDLSARRTAHGIRVTWRTLIPARFVEFLARTVPVDSSGDFAKLAGHGQMYFAVTLHPQHGERPRRVAVSVHSREVFGERTTTVGIG